MLNARQERFCQLVASGKSASEAYRMAGYGARDVNVTGPRLLANVGIAARVAALQEDNAEAFALSREDALAVLAEIILTPLDEVDAGHRLFGARNDLGPVMPCKMDALKLAAKMCGWEKGTEAENKQAEALNGLAGLLERVRK